MSSVCNCKCSKTAVPIRRKASEVEGSKEADEATSTTRESNVICQPSAKVIPPALNELGRRIHCFSQEIDRTKLWNLPIVGSFENADEHVVFSETQIVSELQFVQMTVVGITNYGRLLRFTYVIHVFELDGKLAVHSQDFPIVIRDMAYLARISTCKRKVVWLSVNENPVVPKKYPALAYRAHSSLLQFLIHSISSDDKEQQKYVNEYNDMISKSSAEMYDENKELKTKLTKLKQQIDDLKLESDS